MPNKAFASFVGVIATLFEKAIPSNVIQNILAL
jgi:hypothetical protein